MELPSGKCFEVGSHEWWEWVNSDKAESFRFECDFGVKGYRARKEEIKARAGSFWYAYKRIDGKLRKRYLGKSEELTLERLESAAYDLAKEAIAKPERQLPNKSVGNYTLEELQDSLREQRANALERENCYSQLLEQKLKLEKQVKELHNELGNCQHWKEEAAKLKAEVEKLHNTLGNQEDKKAIALLKKDVEYERNRANDAVLDGLKAATILHEALKFKSNNATPIKARIKEALKLIDDI